MWATKYRPENFDEVIGQADAIKVLTSSVGKSTTFILHGDSGVGKTTLARIFANHLNGEAIEINGADNNGVDDIRGLISNACYISAFNDYKVFIIDECHMLTTAAWNALLKILEESPKTTLWLLCTTDYSKIPQTIKSRSTDVPLNKIETQDIIKSLHKIAELEGIKADSYSFAMTAEIAKWSEGRMREAIVKFETYINTGNPGLPFGTRDILELLTLAFSGKTVKTAEKLKSLTNQDVYAIIGFINDYMKLLLIRHELPQSVTTAEILDTYTNISSGYVDEMRTLQDLVWGLADGKSEQWRSSLDFMYNFYDKMTKHYNDFRDGRLAISIAILHTMGVNND